MAITFCKTGFITHEVTHFLNCKEVGLTGVHKAIVGLGSV